MKHSLKHLSPTKIKLTVTLDADDLAQARPSTIQKLGRKLKVAGFRPGKAPVAVVEKNLDPAAVESQLVEDIVNDTLVQAVEAEGLRVLDRPQIELGTFEPKTKLDYTAEVEILPAVKLGDYKKLKAATAKIAVTDKEIDEVVERMRGGMAEKTAVERAAQNGDEAVIDFEGTDTEGKAVEGASGKAYSLALGSGSFIPGFEEGLVGKKAGDVVDLPLTFPKDYHHKPLAGAKVNFKVTVSEVKESKLPDTDDDFAKRCGPFETIAELRDDIKSELTKQKQREADDKLKDSLLEQLVKASDVPAPEILVNDQMDSMERDATQNLMYRGQTVEQLLEAEGIDREAWRKREFYDAAVRRVQVGLVLAELSKAEKIEVSLDELQSRLDEMLEMYKDEQIRKQIDTPEARRDIANRLLTEKTVDRLVELSAK